MSGRIEADPSLPQHRRSTKPPWSLRRLRLAGIALVAVFSASAVMSASASASCNYCWHVNGSELASGKSEATKGEATSSYTLTGKALGFIEIAVTCKKAGASGSITGGTPGTDSATINYTECKSNSGLCTPNEPIETKAKSEIVLFTTGGKKYWGDLYTAKEMSGVLTVIECSGGLKAEVTGNVIGEALNEAKEKIEVGKETEAKKGYITFPGASSAKYTNSKSEEKTAELKWEGTAANLQGTSEITLTSGKAWGVFGGSGGEGKESTSLSTTLSGEGKEGGEITVLEGAKVKDKATISGAHASKATGKVKYDVYSEKECKTLVTAAGEGTASGESVSASSEESLEAGKTYYWQASYEGNETNDASTSSCTSEVENVKAKTSLSTKLSGEGKEGEELTVDEGSKVKDKATLSGTNSSSAGGKALYRIFSDKECKTLVKEAGEVTVSSGSVPASSEEELEGGKTYYWQATYKGDGLHEESSSSCGSEVVKVKAKTTLSTKLSGEGKESEELTIEAGSKAKDTATLSGTNSSTATGKVAYNVYSDSKCEHLVAEAGEVELESGAKIPASTEVELEGGNTYYWQGHYNGDALHQESTSSCTEILTVQASKYAALGDSYSSGEGTNNYYGNVTNTPEGEAGEVYVERIEKEGYSAVGDTNQCHRSPKAYPVFVAEALFGAGAGNEVFAQQPRKFIFRACSGAIMENLWPGKGQWHEWVTNVNGVAGKEEWFEAPVSGPTFPAYGPEQDSWLELPGGIPYELHAGKVNANKGIGLVTFSIGGNDAGFATVAANCPMSSNSSLNSTQEYSLTRCEEALNEWETGTPGQWYEKAAKKATKEGKIVAPFSPEGHGLLSILSGLPTVLTDVHTAAPNATIGVVMYPQIFDIKGPKTIKIGGSENGIWLGEAPVAFHGRPYFYLGEAQAEKLASFETRLNGIIQITAEKWAEEKGAKAIAINTEKAFEGHELGDQETSKGVTSWVNPIVWRPNTLEEGWLVNGEPIAGVESFHPNCEGHLAIAKTVLTALQKVGIGKGVPSPEPEGWTCP
jgi:hypothetical protein